MALLVGCPACDRLARTDTDTPFVAPAFVCEGCEVATSVRRLAASDPTIAMLLAVWRERQALATRRTAVQHCGRSDRPCRPRKCRPINLIDRDAARRRGHRRRVSICTIDGAIVCKPFGPLERNSRTAALDRP